MSTVKEYWKKKLTNQNIEVEYSSEDDQIHVHITHKLNSGDVIGHDHIRFHPSYIEPLYKLLKAVTVRDEGK